MNTIFKIIITSLIITTSWNTFGKENNYSFTSNIRYKNKDIIGYDLIIKKEPADSTKKAEVYWKIGPENLPVTEDQCYKNNFEVWLPEDEGYGNYRPCLQYGPEFLDYDSTTDKLYFSVDSSEVGTTGVGSRFVFVGDLNKKEIKQLGIIDGPPERNVFSPSHKYLAFSYFGIITILNTLSGERIDITKENIKTKKYHETHYLDDLHWIDDDRFTFLDKTNDRYTNSHITFKNTYDIPSCKIINTRKI